MWALGNVSAVNILTRKYEIVHMKYEIGDRKEEIASDFVLAAKFHMK